MRHVLYCVLVFVGSGIPHIQEYDLTESCTLLCFALLMYPSFRVPSSFKLSGLALLQLLWPNKDGPKPSDKQHILVISSHTRPNKITLSSFSHCHQPHPAIFMSSRLASYPQILLLPWNQRNQRNQLPTPSHPSHLLINSSIPLCQIFSSIFTSFFPVVLIFSIHLPLPSSPLKFALSRSSSLSHILSPTMHILTNDPRSTAINRCTQDFQRIYYIECRECLSTSVSSQRDRGPENLRTFFSFLFFF